MWNNGENAWLWKTMGFVWSNSLTLFDFAKAICWLCEAIRWWSWWGFRQCEMDGMIMEMIVEAFPGMVMTSRAMVWPVDGREKMPAASWWLVVWQWGRLLMYPNSAPAYLPAQLLERSTRVQQGFVSMRSCFCVLGKPLSSGLQMLRYACFVFLIWSWSDTLVWFSVLVWVIWSDVGWYGCGVIITSITLRSGWLGCIFRVGHTGGPQYSILLVGWMS